MNRFICKFVFKGDNLIGDSIDVYKDYLIVKDKSDFIAIPLQKVERVEEDKIFVFEFNKDEARRVGEKWLDEKSKPLNLDELSNE